MPVEISLCKTVELGTGEIIYIGWIYGNKKDRATLERLGVKGEMIWRISNNHNSLTVAARTKRGIFEHCECSLETLGRLEKEYPAFFRDSFTKTNKEEYREYRRQFEGIKRPMKIIEHLFGRAR